MRHFTAFAAALALVFVQTPVSVEAKTKSDISFTFPTDKPIKIAIFRPDVSVGSLGMSGVVSPNADWTASARKNLDEALRKDLQTYKMDTVFLESTNFENDERFNDYQALFRAAAASVVQHKFYGAKLPTKKDKFDWTLGPGIKALGDQTGADYGLLLYTNDAYDSGGKKAFSMLTLNFAAMLMSGIHVAYASLVDLKTGQIVWFNVKLRTKGDPRKMEGAEERITNLLSTLPGRQAMGKK
jgi:hypothetical protein